MNKPEQQELIDQVSDQFGQAPVDSDSQAKESPRKTSIVEKLMAIKWGFVVRRVLVILLATPILVMIGLAPIVGQPLYNWLLFHPVKYPAGEYTHTTVNGITPADVYFKSAGGAKLHGFMYRLPGSKRVVLISHGNGGNMSQRAHIAFMLTRAGNSVFAYDYAGYGRSQGEPSMGGICQDAHGAYDYLRSQEHYDPKQIILFGESLGTLATGNLASSVDCAGVILECPLYSLQRIGCDLVPYLKKYPQWAWTDGSRQLDNSVALPRIRVPLIIIAGTADQLTPIKYADELIALANSPKRYVRIPGAGHGDRVMITSPAYGAGLKQFLQDLNQMH